MRLRNTARTRLYITGLHAGRPIRLHLTAGQTSDYKGAELLLSDLPASRVVIADRGYDSNKIRKTVTDQDIEAYIPSRKTRKKKVPYCTRTYRKRHKVENLFAKLKDWRRIAMRYDRCASIFKSAIYIAATVIFWL
ncbi:DDE transposase [Pseudovibrio japonicus]|uniref:DDE transposase n=1 Tax=Pseudovibrio japonicus TaxID=366534 RepID=A0ABQ3EPH6_9HYPH|nr:DDE transposase [Pseudovibrio japonicus]